MKSAERYARTGETVEAVRAYLAAGNAFLNDESDVARAREAYAAAASLDPDNLEAIFQLGHADAIEGKLREALARFVTVTRKSNATHVPALFDAACIYQELGMYDQAILAFRKVLDRDRTNVQAIVNVAQRLLAMGMRPEALGHFLRAAETAFEANQLGTCRQLLNLILSMDPLNAKVRTMLADLNDLKAAESAEAAHGTQASTADVVTAATASAAVENTTIAAVDDLASARHLAEDAVALLRTQRDSLVRDIEALAKAKASEEIELATLRARRDTSTAELTELFKKVEAVKAEEKAPPAKLKVAPATPKAAPATPKAAPAKPKAIPAKPKAASRPSSRIGAEKSAKPVKKSKTRVDRTLE